MCTTYIGAYTDIQIDTRVFVCFTDRMSKRNGNGRKPVGGSNQHNMGGVQGNSQETDLRNPQP